MAILNPYLNFNGNCEEAFNYYKSVFGGEFVTVMKYGEMPGEQPMSEADKKKLMHVSLPIGKGTTLMGSDMPESMPAVIIGNNFTISVNVDNEAEADKIFDGLAAGGKVSMPMQNTFWSPYFGMCADRFGIQWMVNCSETQQK